MTVLPRFLIIQFDNLSSILYELNHSEFFPTIDTDALLSIIIDVYSLNINVNTENILKYLMEDDYISDRIDLDETQTVKLEMLLHRLLLTIRQKLNQINVLDNNTIPYRYKERRRNGNVLLEYDEDLSSARSIND